MGAASRTLAPPSNKLHRRRLLTVSIRGILFNQQSSWPQIIGALLRLAYIQGGIY